MNLVINSTFRPFTYDEMVKPLVQYKEAYDEKYKDFSDLRAQAEMWKDIANRDSSPEAFAMYKRFMDDFNVAASEFIENGMKTGTSKALMRMKGRFSQDITPIVLADAALKEANDFRAKAGPDAIFEVGQYDSLDSFLHGKKANNRYQSREALTKEAAAMTEAAMSEAINDPEFKKVMGDQFWQITQHSGGSYKDLVEAMKIGMMDNPLAQNRFSQIRQALAKKAGIQNYDANGQQAIMNAIDLGLYAGLDKPVITFQANQGYLNPLQQEQLRQMRMARSSGGGGGSSKGGKEEEEKPGKAYVPNDVIIEYNSDGSGNVQYYDTKDYDKVMAENDPGTVRSLGTSIPLTGDKNSTSLQNTYGHGYSYANEYLGDADASQFEFFVRKAEKGNDGKERTSIRIRQKGSHHTPGPAQQSSKTKTNEIIARIINGG